MKRGQQVLACCPSHVAVDNLMDALRSNVPGIRLCRAGVASKIKESSLEFSLDSLMAKRASLEESKDPNSDNITLSKVLSSVDVILATNAGAGDGRILSYTKSRRKVHKDLTVVIDEAGQATEPLTWTAVRLGCKTVLAGDHMQLQPIVKALKAVEGGLGVTMFERLVKLKFEDGEMIPRSLLKIQYRMSPLIMQWCSQAMYNNELIAAESVVKNAIGVSLRGRIQELNSRPLSMLTSKEMVMIDTAGCDAVESAAGHSKCNAV